MTSFWFRFALLVAFPLSGFAAPVKIWVELRDKGPLSISGIAGENVPVYVPYLQQLKAAGFTLDIALKWQNRVSGWIDSEKVGGLNRLSIVRSVEGMPRKAPYIRMASNPSRNVLSKMELTPIFGVFQPVFDTTEASALRVAITTAGQTAGQGMRVSIIDADFDLGNQAFNHLKQNGLIADQWDFVSNKPVIVKDSLSSSHGAATLSLLGGQSSDFEGMVPNAKFLLYRAENVATETYVEEDYVAAAIERAVDSGAKVISISLGYRYDYTDTSQKDLPYSSLNGRTRPSSLAALGAARRNVLVSVSMGNDGGRVSTTPTISAPADADSILSVGILDINLKPCSYTSTGPTYDHRVKPEVSTVGTNSCATPTVDATVANGYKYQAGTSFAAPVIAGIATLLRQLHPTASAQSIRQALIVTAAKYAHPDSAAGNGLVRSLDAHNVLNSISDIALNGPYGPEKGMFPWYRNRERFNAPWKPGLDPSAARLWDLQGRSIPVHAGAAIPVLWIDPGNQAAGIYVWKIP